MLDKQDGTKNEVIDENLGLPLSKIIVFVFCMLTTHISSILLH